MRYAHTNIVCHDWKALVNFYVTVFACRIKPPIRNQSGDWLSQGTGVKNARLEGAHLLLPGHGEDGPTLEVFQYADTQDNPAVAPNQRGFGHLAFEVEDVSETLAQVLAHGGTKNGELTIKHVEGVGELTFIYVRDPEGNLIELQSWRR